MSDTWYLIDASGYIFRAYHALPPMTRPDGTPVGAVYGYCNVLWKLEKELRAQRILVVFDAARKNFRNEIYPEYKAHRPPAPDDLIPQFPLFREATTAFGLPWVEQEGFEADDLIATYARQLETRGDKVVIVSGDKDLMQLVNETITLYDPVKSKPIGIKEVEEKFGVSPARVVDMQALIGDASDNIPGVAGIGIKTAAELLKTYGTLENLLANAAEIPQNKRRETLIHNADKARLSYQLAALKTDVPLSLPLEQVPPVTTDWEVVRQFFAAQHFRALLTRLGGHSSPSSSSSPQSEALSPSLHPTKDSKDYTLIRTFTELRPWLETIVQQGVVAIDTETTSLDAHTAELVGVSLGVGNGKACYIPLTHTLLAASGDQLPIADLVTALKPILEDESILKIGHNIKYDALVLARYGLTITPIDDSMVMSYALTGTANSHSMDTLASLYLGIDTIPYDAVTGTGKHRLSFADVAMEEALAYAAEDADVTYRLWALLKQELRKAGRLSVYEQLDRPLVSVLTRMEKAGILVDAARLRELSAEFASGLARLETEIYASAGVSFNIASPKQLGEILFEKLGIAGGKKSKTGAYATGVEVLEPLAAAGHMVPKLVLEWRGLAKLKSTYTDALLQQIHPITGRIHSSFAQTLTSTGRLSSSNPNLQNIPIRTETGRKIRSAFIAPKGRVLLSLDYSQIELRVLAEMAGIESLQTAFAEGVDVHTLTASQVFGMPLAEVDSTARRKAKAVNFGIIYGISPYGLAAQLGCTSTEAKELIAAYFRQYPGIEAYMQQTIETAKKQGYVKTLFGRHCHIEGIADKNGAVRQNAERAAINAPIQGTAADIMRAAMIAVDAALPSSATLVLQVHDELVIECEREEVDSLTILVRSLMIAAGRNVPLEVDSKVLAFGASATT